MRLSKTANQLSRDKRSESAFICDEESIRAVFQDTTKAELAVMHRNYGLARIGMPVEVYDGKALGEQVTQVEVDLEMGQTIMLQMT